MEKEEADALIKEIERRLLFRIERMFANIYARDTDGFWAEHHEVDMLLIEARDWID